MTRMIMIAGMLALLGGCVHLQDFNPFYKEPAPAVPPPEPVVEKIGPDVIAVPVEPVEAENMLQPAAVPAPAP